MNIVNYLIDEVRQAAGNDTERNVLTFISRAMWRAWCAALGDGEVEPTPWQGAENTHRVFGSETIIVDNDDFWVYCVNKEKFRQIDMPEFARKVIDDNFWDLLL